MATAYDAWKTFDAEGEEALMADVSRSRPVQLPRLDVLDQLRQCRSDALNLLRDPTNDYRCFLGRHAMGSYRRLRARAMRRSPLPSDIAPRSALERAE